MEKEECVNIYSIGIKMASTKIEILKIPVIPNIQHGCLLPATLLMESYTGACL